MSNEMLRVGQLCWEKAPKLWRGRQVLRVAKRKYSRNFSKNYGSTYQSYFVVTWKGGVGHGAWMNHEQLVPLSPLELLAVQADEGDDTVID